MQAFKTIFAGKVYVIPENQRGFSWSEREFNSLIDDLTLSEQHAHYMGPLIISRTDTDDFNDDNWETTAEFTLEDGQQRLTSLLILVSEIRSRMKELGGDKLPIDELEKLIFFKKGDLRRRLKNKNTPLDEYLSYILTGAPQPPAQRTPPMNAMDRVRAAARTFVSGMAWDDLVKWKAKILNQAKFISVDLKQENINRYLAFDAINSRGLPLSEFDKIKNFCILVASSRGLVVQADQSWYRAIGHLDDFGLTNRNEEAAFITELFNVFHNQSVGQAGVHAAFVDRYTKLLATSDAVLESDFLSFVSFWEPYAKSFGFIASKERRSRYGGMCTDEAGVWLDRLDNMDLATILRPVLVTSHMRMDKPGFQQIARAAEIYTFRVYGVMQARKDRNAGRHVTLANEILRGGAATAGVLSKICELTVDNAPLAQVLARLVNGEPKYAYDPRMTGWSQCYYFLYEYEIGNSPKGVNPLPWANSKSGKINTQEHILPQTHRDGAWWQAHWPDEAKADRFKHRLGNLVLTSNNSALGRKPIAEKLAGPGAHFFRAPQATNGEKRIDQFTDGVSWSHLEILRREVELVKFAAKRWAIPCCGDNGLVTLDAFSDLDAEPLTIVIDEAHCIAETALEEEEDLQAEELEVIVEEEET